MASAISTTFLTKKGVPGAKHYIQIMMMLFIVITAHRLSRAHKPHPFTRRDRMGQFQVTPSVVHIFLELYLRQHQPSVL